VTVADVDQTPEPERQREAEPEMLHGALVHRGADCVVLFPERDSYCAVVEALRDDGFDMIIDVTAVDYLLHPNRELPDGVQRERFEVVTVLLDHERRQRVRLRTQVPESDPRMPTLFHVFTGAEAPEREAYDMFGIAFDDHPDLNRILMPEDWEGHPLRKDYAVGRIPVEFKGAPGPR
jgi:NADH-quinone oxidoreductase subunit C